MITHDVDEAVLLSDRIVMMTNGPAARIGEVLDVPLARPRKRLELVGRPDLLQCRAARAASSSTRATRRQRCKRRSRLASSEAMTQPRPHAHARRWVDAPLGPNLRMGVERTAAGRWQRHGGLKLVEELSSSARPLRDRGRGEERAAPTTACCCRRCWPARSQATDVELRPAAWYAEQRHHAAQRRRKPSTLRPRAQEVVALRRRPARLRPAGAGHRLAGRSGCRCPA